MIHENSDLNAILITDIREMKGSSINIGSDRSLRTFIHRSIQN